MFTEAKALALWAIHCHSNFAYDFIGFRAMDDRRPYEFKGFGAIREKNAYQRVGFRAMDDCSFLMIS